MNGGNLVKKTFRRAIACLLAVLMVAFSMPITALAVTPNREWWVDDGVELPITEEPEYLGQNDLDDWEFEPGDNTLELSSESCTDVRDYCKPIIAVIVSDLGTNDTPVGSNGLGKYYNSYYAAGSKYDYDTVSAAGKILNPADLKAGQRIAVTVECGGFDTICMGQIKGKYNNEYLAAKFYTGNPKSKDTWASTTQAAKSGGGGLYTNVQGMGSLEDERGLFYSAIINTALFNGDITKSVYLGNGADERGFGKYGCAFVTFTFEVLQDCDLTEVFTFDGGSGGTFMTMFYEDEVAEDGRQNITMDNDDDQDATSFAHFAPVIWDSYEKTETGDTTQYTVKFVNAAGETVSETKYDEGTAADDVTVPANTTTTDSHVTYAWPTVENVTGDATYIETSTTADHIWTIQTTVKTATCTTAGEEVWVCSVGGETQTRYPEATGVHQFTNYVANDDATCEKNGTETATCDLCGVAKDTKDIENSTVDHQFTNYVSDNNATCEADGTKTATCDLCGKVTDTKTDEGSQLSHKFTNYVSDNNATCEADGTKTATCDLCGKVTDTKTDEGSKLAHQFTNYVSDNNATCEADGTKTATCDLCGKVKDTKTDEGSQLAHKYTKYVYNNDATYEADGTETATCDLCGKAKDTRTATGTKLTGIEITVLPSDLGTSKVNDSDVVADAVTVNVANNSDVTLVATPVDGATFVGWNVNGKIVSTDAQTTIKAIADATYEPVFQIDTDESFTVVFTDKYGNIISTQTVSSGAEITIPDEPTIAGYTAAGWSLSDDAIKALAEAATINAKYERDVELTYTVTATGATITTPYATTQDVNTGIGYNTLVTVTADGAKAWKIGDATVAYGTSYSFYVGSDVEVTPVFDNTTDATPTVAAVSQTELNANGKTKVSFLATRSMTDDCTYVNAGFVYGKNLANDEIKLNDVDGSAVKAYYCSTNSEQFALTYSLAAQSGKMTVRAFLAYVDAEGETQVIYAEPQTYTYR
jgi:hypothetical protein